jgi:hypothetical protein
MLPTILAALRFWALRSVLRSALLPIGHAGGVERAADDVITNTGEIFHAAPANQHDRVLLQVVPDSGYISGYFDSIGKPHASHFSQRRIRLLGSGSVYARTDPTLLRAAIQRRTGCFPAWRLPPVTHKLVKRWHEFPLRCENQQVARPALHGMIATAQSANLTTRSQKRGLLLQTGPYSIRSNR